MISLQWNWGDNRTLASQPRPRLTVVSAKTDPRTLNEREAARMACFSDIEGFYNPLRRHSALGYRSPVIYEREAASEASTMNLLSQVP